MHQGLSMYKELLGSEVDLLSPLISLGTYDVSLSMLSSLIKPIIQDSTISEEAKAVSLKFQKTIYVLRDLQGFSFLDVGSDVGSDSWTGSFQEKDQDNFQDQLESFVVSDSLSFLFNAKTPYQAGELCSFFVRTIDVVPHVQIICSEDNQVIIGSILEARNSDDGHHFFQILFIPVTACRHEIRLLDTTTALGSCPIEVFPGCLSADHSSAVLVSQSLIRNVAIQVKLCFRDNLMNVIPAKSLKDRIIQVSVISASGKAFGSAVCRDYVEPDPSGDCLISNLLFLEEGNYTVYFKAFDGFFSDWRDVKGSPLEIIVSSGDQSRTCGTLVFKASRAPVCLRCKTMQ